MKQLIKPAVFITAALCALFVASCAYSFFGETASIRVSISLAGNRGVRDAESPRLLRPDTAYIVVEVSGSDMSTISSGKSPIDSSTGTASVRIEGIPISSLERKITISAYSAAGLLLSSGSSTRTLVRGANDVAIVLAPNPTQVNVFNSSGPPAWNYPLSIPANSAYVAQLNLPDTGDYCLSLGYSTAQFTVYDSTGKPAERVKGSPENWFILHDNPEPSCYVMVLSPDGNDTLKIEKAVYVSPGASGTNAGTRADPFTSFSSATYASVASPCRFLLARGAYESTSIEVTKMKSIYGGFDPSTWSRDLGPGVPMTELRGTSNGSGILHNVAASTHADNVSGDTVIDGVWIKANTISGDGLDKYYAANFDCSPSIQNCRITGPKVMAGSGLKSGAQFGALAFSIDSILGDTIPTRIVGNIISAGRISATNTVAAPELNGIYASGVSKLLLVANNEIDGGYVASSSNVNITGSATVFLGPALVINNTIASGRLANSGTSKIYGIKCETLSSSLYIINNIIIDSETSTAGGVTSACVYAADDPENRPVYLMNNYSGQRSLDSSSGSSAYIYRNDSGAINTQNDLYGSDGSNPSGSVNANVAKVFNSSYFASYGNPTLLDDWALNRNWSLSSSVSDPTLTSLKSGGMVYKDLLDMSLVLSSSSNLQPYLRHDRKGKLRPVSGWSMGAYQN